MKDFLGGGDEVILALQGSVGGQNLVIDVADEHHVLERVKFVSVGFTRVKT